MSIRFGEYELPEQLEDDLRRRRMRTLKEFVERMRELGLLTSPADPIFYPAPGCGRADVDLWTGETLSDGRSARVYATFIECNGDSPGYTGLVRVYPGGVQIRVAEGDVRVWHEPGGHKCDDVYYDNPPLEKPPHFQGRVKVRWRALVITYEVLGSYPASSRGRGRSRPVHRDAQSASADDHFGGGGFVGMVNY